MLLRCMNTCDTYNLAISQLTIPVASIVLTLVLTGITTTCCLTDDCIVMYTAWAFATLNFVPPISDIIITFVYTN